MKKWTNWLKKRLDRLSVDQAEGDFHSQNVFPRLYESRLEERRVLNASGVVAAVDLLNLSFDAGKSSNDGHADKFELSRISTIDGNRIAVSINDQQVWQGDVKQVQSIRLNGSSDADQFFVDPTIQLAAGVFVNGSGITSDTNALGSTDIVVIATASETVFDEVNYQSTDHLTQIHLLAESHSMDSVIQVENVSSIYDFNRALSKSIEIDSQHGEYQLHDSLHSATGQMLELSSGNSAIHFAVPSDRLSIHLQNTQSQASDNSLIIDTQSTLPLSRFEIVGGDSDSVQQTGRMTIGKSLAIHAGTIRVDGTISTGPEGEVKLDAGSGLLSLTGEILSQGDELRRGGLVVLTGDRVFVQDHARVDVSGGVGGGQIRIGGGYQGKDVNVRNSSYTYVGSNATLVADALVNGDGGTIIVWSDDTAIVDGSGNIFARGGSYAGNGGFIETSGKRYLKVDGAANTFAYHGQVGTWLLDPNNIEIVTTAGSTALTTYVTISTISSALSTGNMVITTSTVSAGAGDITIVDAVSLSPSTSRLLTLNATRDILFKNTFTGNSNLQLVLNAGQDVDATFAGATIGQLASLLISANRNVKVGTVNLSGGAFSATIDSDDNDANAVFQSSGALSAGSISIIGSTTFDDDVNFGSTVTSTTSAIQFSQVDDLIFQADVTSATGIAFSNVAGPLSLGSSVDMTASNGPIDFTSISAGILLAGSNSTTNVLTSNGTTGSLTLGNVTATNTNVSLTLSSTRDISTGGVNIQNGTLTVFIDSNNNNSGASFSSTAALSAGAISISGSLTVNDDVTIGSTATTSSNAIQFTKIRNLTLQGDISSAAGIAFTSVNGLTLGSNVDITSSSGILDFTSLSGGIVLGGSNGSISVITGNGTSGSIKMASVTATNTDVDLTLNSATDIDANDINIKSGSLAVTYSAQDPASPNVATFQKVTARSMTVSGNSRTDDQTVLNDTLTIGAGGVTIDQFAELQINANITSDGSVTTTGIASARSHLAADVVSNGGNIAMSGGTLLVDASSIRSILSGGSALSVTTGGSITLGNIDGENGVATLKVDSRGGTDAGSVSLGQVTATSGNGLNKLSIRTDSTTNTGVVTLSSTRLIAVSGTASSLVVDSSGKKILAAGIIDLSSSSSASGGLIDFGSSVIAPSSPNSSLTLKTNNSNTGLVANAGDIHLGGVTSNGTDYFNQLIINANAASLTGFDGDLNFSSASNPIVAVDGTSGTGISLIGTIIKSFTGVLKFLTNPNNAAQSSSDIDVTKASFNVARGFEFDTSGGNHATNAGNVLLGDVGSSTAATSLKVDTRGTVSAGLLKLNDSVTNSSTAIHVSGVIDLSNSHIELDDDVLLDANGINAALNLGQTTTNGTAQDLTLTSDGNITASSIDLQGGVLTATVDTDNNQAGAQLQTTGAISAGSIRLAGTSSDDTATLGGSLASTTGGIQFTNISQLALGSSVNITSANGLLDFTTLPSGVMLNGANATANVITANGASGSIKLPAVTATNTNVALTLNSATNVDANDIDIQSGDLAVNYSAQDAVSANVATFNKVTAGSLSVSGNSRSDDETILNDTLTIGSGGVVIDKFDDLQINAAINSDGDIAITGTAASKTHLANDVVTNGGNIAMTNGTLFINASAARSIKSGGASLGTATGGAITLGDIDGENGLATLNVDSRGATTAGSVSIGQVTATGTNGLNRLNIRTDSTNAGQVTLSSIRLAAKSSPATASTLVVNAGGGNILAAGTIDLSSSSSVDGGSMDFGGSQLAPTATGSSLTLKTNNTNSATGGNGGDIRLGGIANRGSDYFNQLSIDTSAARSTKTAGDLDFNSVSNPTVAVDGTSGTGVSLIGTIIKSFVGVLKFLTNPNSAAQSSSAIDATKANFDFAGGLEFNTSGVNATNAGNVLLGDVGVNTRPTSLKVDTLGTSTTGLLKLNDGAVSSTTDIHIAGNIDFQNATIELDDNVVLDSTGANAAIDLGLTITDGSARNLTLTSNNNINLTGIDLQGGVLTATVDTDNDQVGASLQSTGAISAGSITLAGTASNDTVTLGGSLSSTTGAIQFTSLDKLTLASSANITSASGLLDFTTFTSGVLLNGANATTNVITASSTSGSIKMAPVTATNPNVSLTLNSATNVDANDIQIQSGTLRVNYSGQNVAAPNVATFKKVTAGTMTVSGNSRTDDQTVLNDALTIGNGGVTIVGFADLQINAAITSDGIITTTGTGTAKTHLDANVVSNGGNIAITGGTLLVDGALARAIKSGGLSVGSIAGGTITLGAIDGETSAADLTIDSRGSSTAGNVVVGVAQKQGANTGLNRLLIVTDSTTAGQVSLSSIRLVTKTLPTVTAPSLVVQSNGTSILADGLIDLSSSVVGQAGGLVNFGNSVVAPKAASSTLAINTNNTNTTSGVDGSNGGNVTLGGIGVNSTNQAYFDSVSINMSAADPLDLNGTLSFGTVTNPSVQVDGLTGTGIQIQGRVSNPAGGTLSFLTNPDSAVQNSSAINVSLAYFIGSGGLVFDTSGGLRSRTSGGVSLGDIGTTIRPVSLVVDTRGTVSSSHLTLNDGDNSSVTEILVDGTIDFTKTTIDLLDDVVLQSNPDGSNILLGQINAVGGARNLQLTSGSGITVAGVSLAGGTLTANVDSNNNEIGAAFQSNGVINVGSLVVGGSAAKDDIATIGANVTTTGSVSIANFDRLRVQGNVNAGTNVNVSNISGAIEFSGSSGISAFGSIDLLTSVQSIVLTGVAGDVTLIDAKGNTSTVSLATVTAANAGNQLSVRSDYSVDLRDVNLLDGTLNVLVGRSTTQTDSKAQLRNVTAGTFIARGTTTANDSIALNGLVQIGTGGIDIQTFNKLDINNDMQSGGGIVANNITDRIQVADGISVRSALGADLQTNVGRIQLVGGVGGLTNLFQANGDNTTLKLASIVAIQNVSLSLSSANSIDVISIDARGSSLAIKVDNNDNTVGSSLTAGPIQVAQMTILGGTDQNDTSVFSGLIESAGGSILVQSFGTAGFNGDVSAATGLEVSNVADRIDVGAGRLLKANGGDVIMNNNVNQIRFAGGAGTTTTIQSLNGSLFASALTELNASRSIVLRADRDVRLQSSRLNSPLQIVAGDHSSSTGSIQASSTIAASSLSLDAATGIGGSGTLQTSTALMSANNRLAGDISIANTIVNIVIVSSIASHQGGNIVFSQVGGGDIQFQSVSSDGDSTPTTSEANIHLRNTGGDLTAGSISAGGKGSVSLEATNSGSIQFASAIQAIDGAVTANSSQLISGPGLVSGASVGFLAGNGIGGVNPIHTSTQLLSAHTTLGTVNIQNTSAAPTTISDLSSSGVGSINYLQLGAGGVQFQNVSTGVGASNISLRSDAGRLTVLGPVRAGGIGSIALNSAQNDLVLEHTAILETVGTAATIDARAGGRFVLVPGAVLRAGSSNANTEAVVTQLPPTFAVVPVVNTSGVNVDALGVATIRLQIGSPSQFQVDRNYSVIIDWGDNQIDNFPLGQISPLTINPQIARFDASSGFYEITHQYLGNPNPRDPIAPIPFQVSVGIDPLNRIHVADSQSSTNALLTETVNQQFEVPAAGLFSLRFDLPQATAVPSRIVFNNALVNIVTAVVNQSAKPLDVEISAGGSAVQQEKSYVLQMITPKDEQGGIDASEDVPLKEEDINDLSKLFNRLGDNRYRIYLIREDGNRLILKDFYLRDHRPVEIDETEGIPANHSTERVLDGSTSDLMKSSEANAIQVLDPSDSQQAASIGSVNAAIAIGSAIPTVRSWRKAARRYRTGSSGT